MTSIALFVVLGLAVAHRPPSAFDTALEQAWFGQAIGLAWAFTYSGLWAVQLPLGAALVVFGALARAWRVRAWFSVGANLTAHFVSDGAKNAFERARPEHWAIVHESSYAYPSGHAVTATVVFGLWAWLLLRSELAPRLRIMLAIACAAWGVGICWSRIALGAHWPTDVIGGCLLGLGWVTVLAAAWGMLRAWQHDAGRST